MNEKGNGWHPNLAVRVEVESPYDDGAFLEEAVHKLADTLAAMGIRVDPQAPVLARFTIGEPKPTAPGPSNLQMQLQFQGPEGNVWHVAAFKQEPTITSADAGDQPRFRAQTLAVIASYSPLRRTLPDNPPLGQINTFVSHSFLPDDLPPRITRS